MATITGITTACRPETVAVMFRTILRFGAAAALASLGALAHAQQNAAPVIQPVPYVNQQAAQPAPPPAIPSQSAAPSQTPAAAAQPPEAADSSLRAAKPVSLQVPHELSPWSMFLNADILVKAVMIGLAFASLVTWTIFIAKMIELSVVTRRLRDA